MSRIQRKMYNGQIGETHDQRGFRILVTSIKTISAPPAGLEPATL